MSLDQGPQQSAGPCQARPAEPAHFARPPTCSPMPAMRNGAHARRQLLHAVLARRPRRTRARARPFQEHSAIQPQVGAPGERLGPGGSGVAASRCTCWQGWLAQVAWLRGGGGRQGGARAGRAQHVPHDCLGGDVQPAAEAVALAVQDPHL